MPEGERLFFALWPPADLQARVVAQTQGLINRGAQALAAGDLHITLAFLGETGAQQRSCYEQAARVVRGAAFHLQLDVLGQWPTAGVLWLAPSIVPPALRALVQNLNGALAACGFMPEARAYQPHMTVARKYTGALVATRITPLGWCVEQLVLAVSARRRAAARYRVVAAWPLASGAGAGPAQ